MKNYFLLFAFCLTGSFIGCQTDETPQPLEHGDKLLSRMVTDFETGQQNIDSFLYVNEKLVRHKSFINGFYSNDFSYSYSGNTIEKFYIDMNGTVGTSPILRITLNNEGAMIKLEWEAGSNWYENTFEYDVDGHLTRQLLDNQEGIDFITLVTDAEGNIIMTYPEDNSTPDWSENAFDDKINPLRNMPSFVSVVEYGSPNNIVHYEGYVSNVKTWETINTYEYDEEGYPTKKTTGNDITRFYYDE